jgi:hypothetical protein
MTDGITVAADPVPAGKDASAAPLQQASPDAARADAATTAAGLGSAAAGSQVKTAPAKSGMVTLATAAPLGSVTVDDVVITEEGTEVDEATAERAHEAAQLAGFRLREI